MVTQIQLGNLFSSNGKTVLGGIGGSGFDTATLLSSLAEAKRLPAVALENKIELNGKKATAFGEFRSLLSQFQDAANFLRNPPGVDNAAQNIFKYTTGSVTSNTSVAGSSYLTVAASPGAQVSTYNITDITSIAKAKQQTTGSLYITDANSSVVTSAATPGFFKAGTVTINGTDITFSAGDSLNTVLAKFNSVKSSTGISASSVKVATGEYKILFTATNTGTDADFSLNDPGTITDATGVFSMISRTNLLTNGTFNADIAGWTDASLGTGGIDWDGAGALQLDGDGAGGNEAFAQQAMTTEIGQQYTVTATFADLQGSAFIRIGNDADPSLAGNFDIEDFEVMADGTVSFTFTATSTTTYLTINSDTNSDPFTVDNISVVNTATQAVTTTEAAANTQFKLNDIDITRQTASVNDVVEGVTFGFLQTTPALTELAVNIKPDESLIKDGIINLINTYNNLKLFAAQQTETDSEGLFTENALLHGSNAFRLAMDDVVSQMSSVVNGITSGASRLSELGITFVDLPATPDNPQVRNILTVDEGKLSAAIATNLENVRRVFEFDLVSDSADLTIFSRTNALSATNFTLEIDPGMEIFNAYIDGVGDPIALQATPLSGGLGYTLRGVAGTEFEGLVLIYSSTNSATINVSATQGLADKVYNSSALALNPSSGTITLALNALKTSDDTLQEEIDRIDAQVAIFRDQLLAKFQALEQAVSRVNILLQSLDAQDQARNNS